MSKTKQKKDETEIMTIEEKLFITRFRPHTEPHIKTNQDICIMCKGKECTKFCPANVFAWSNINDELIVFYENCLECTACIIGCPYEAIEYIHPKAGFGKI